MNSDDNNQTNNGELDVNRKNREDYEKLMQKSSTQLNDYWDSNNIIVRIILGLLGIFIVCGVLYYVLMFLGKV